MTGDLYAADFTSPTPTQLTAAVGDMQGAYTNGAGRSNPDYLEYQAGTSHKLNFTGY